VDDDPEIRALLVQIRKAELMQQLAAFTTKAEAPMVVVEDLALPINEGLSQPHKNAIDMKTGMPLKKTQLKINFRLSERQFGILQKRFPGVLFCQPDFGGHDHPVAHVETMLGTRRLQSMLPGGTKILDLFGNPTANQGYNALQRGRHAPKHVDTMVSVLSAKDVLRKAIKYGLPMTKSGEERYWDLNGRSLRQILDDFQAVSRLAEYDSFMMVHTMYYASREDLAALLNIKPGTPLRALVHRHKYSTEKVTLFGGEIEYTCGPISPELHDFVVTQRNVETNESYTHLSLEWMWRSQNKVFIAHNGEAFTWDLQKFTEDTWIATLVACDPCMDEGYANRERISGPRAVAMQENVRSLGEDHTEAVSFPIGKVVAAPGALTLVLPGTEFRELRITNPDFYNMLRKHVSGKKRDEKLWRQVTALAVRETDKDNNYPGGRKYEVEAGDVNDHVVAAFVADVKREVLNLEGLATFGVDLRRQRRLFSSATEAVDATRNNAPMALARGLHTVFRAAKMHGAREALDVLLE
jgi:hypothetical protein